MKLSEARYEDVKGLLISPDNSDCVTEISSEEFFEHVRERIMKRYGDVTIEFDNSASDYWHKLHICDDKWKQDHDDYIQRKLEWCRRFGCE